MEAETPVTGRRRDTGRRSRAPRLRHPGDVRLETMLFDGAAEPERRPRPGPRPPRTSRDSKGGKSSTERRTALQSILDELGTLELSLNNRGAAVSNRHATVRAARRLNMGSALLATSVLLDSAVEHYRGSFQNRAMYTPLVVSFLSLAMSAHGTTDREPEVHHVRQAVSVTTALTGMAGLELSPLERHEAAGPPGLAEPVLRRTVGRPDRNPSGRPARHRGGAGARQSLGRTVAPAGPAGGADAGRAQRAGPAGHQQ